MIASRTDWRKYLELNHWTCAHEQTFDSIWLHEDLRQLDFYWSRSNNQRAVLVRASWRSRDPELLGAVEVFHNPASNIDLHELIERKRH